MDGVRYVRNRGHHQWANALTMETDERSRGVLPFLTVSFRSAVERLGPYADCSVGELDRRNSRVSA